MTHDALILVDIQNDYFPDGRWPVDGMEAAAANAACLLAHFRQNNRMVVHVRHEILSKGAPFFAHGSAGAQINPVVQPLPDEPVVLKHRPNSFVDTGLLEILQAAQVETLVICGAMSQMCIDATTRGAVDLGFKVTLPADACAAKAQEFNGLRVPAAQVHATIMAALSSTYARVTSAQDLLA